MQPQGITFQQNTIPDIEVPSKLQNYLELQVEVARGETLAQVETGTVVVVRPLTSSNLPTNRPASLSKHKKPPADSINTFAEGSQINQQCHPSLTSGLKASQVHTVLRKSNYAVPLDWSGLVRTGWDWSSGPQDWFRCARKLCKLLRFYPSPKKQREDNNSAVIVR